MNICQGIIDVSRIFPDKTAIIFQEQELTFRELEDLSGRAASLLSDRGVKRGDRVALMLGNVPAFPVWYYAILRLGAIAVSVNTRLTEEEALFIVSDCGAGVFLRPEGSARPLDLEGVACLAVAEDGRSVDRLGLDTVESIGKGVFLDLDPDDPGIILYTSGTTGFPKGATLSHGNVRSTVHAFNHLCGMTPEDRLLLMVPLFHCYGQNTVLNAGLNVGSTVVMQRVFDLPETRQLIRDHRITRLFGVPTIFQLMLNSCSPEDLESIAYCFSAAATLAPQLGEAWQEKFGKPIYEGYGLTETAPFASYNHPLKHVPGSIGVPVDLVEMKVVDPETGRTCPPGEPGEIAVRGPNVMLGYWNRPDETAEAVRDGWFFSGDVGKMDDNGYFYIVDRIKDMIAVGGLKVFPSEVERILLDAPGVADCAVVGLPETTLGERVVAFVVESGNGEADPEAIRAFGMEHLASYKVPGEIVFLESLPRNPAGKVLKTELRKLGSEGDAGSSSTSSGPDSAAAPTTLFRQLEDAYPSARHRLLTEYLRDQIRRLTASRELPEVSAPLLETGMDSLMMVNFANDLRGNLDSRLELPATLVFDYPRICDLADYLLEHLRFDDGDETPAVPSSIEDMTEEEAELALRKELEDC